MPSLGSLETFIKTAQMGRDTRLTQIVRASYLEKTAPGFARLLNYQRSDLTHGIFAGASVAAVALPVGVAYAQLVGFNPAVGLYSSILPLLAYAIFGTSRQLIIGPLSSCPRSKPSRRRYGTCAGHFLEHAVNFKQFRLEEQVQHRRGPGIRGSGHSQYRLSTFSRFCCQRCGLSNRHERRYRRPYASDWINRRCRDRGCADVFYGTSTVCPRCGSRCR